MLTWEISPQPIYSTHYEFLETSSSCPNSNFLKCVKWSPDGACCLTASDDKWLRVFDLPQDALERPPEQGGATQNGSQQQQQQQGDAGTSGRRDSLRSGLRVHGGESIYDYCWFPGANTKDPASCCFASTTRGHPIHLWDACSGQLRCSYRAHDDADDPTAAYSLAFSPDGQKLLGGYPKCFRIFDVSRPGRDCTKVQTQQRKKEGSMAGIVSCLAFNPPQSDLLAAGAYSGAIGLFDARTHEQLLLLHGHRGGVTQVIFSRDGNYLYSGARRDPKILCWDVRLASEPLYELLRDTGDTNQRLQFDIDPTGRHLATGGCDGRVRVFDLRDGQEISSFLAASDTVSGCQFHPVLGLPLLATASGHRRYPLAPRGDGGGGGGGPPSDDGSGDEARGAAGTSGRRRQGGVGCGGPETAEPVDPTSNALRLWRLHLEWVAVDDFTAGDGAMEEAAGGRHQGLAAAGGGAHSAEAAGFGADDGGGEQLAAAAASIPFVKV